MKKILVILFLFCGLLLSAKGYKVKSKTQIKPFTIKIEKVEYKNNQALVIGNVKQQERFSYSISFEDCNVTTGGESNKTEGKLLDWNGEKKVGSMIKTISDEKEEKFILAFPETAIPKSGSFTLRMGTILNSAKTPIIIEGLKLK